MFQIQHNLKVKVLYTHAHVPQIDYYTMLRYCKMLSIPTLPCFKPNARKMINFFAKSLNFNLAVWHTVTLCDAVIPCLIPT